MPTRIAPLLACAVLTACHGTIGPESGTQVSMSFDRSADFYAAPFPSDDLLQSGHVNVAAFPNPQNVAIITDLVNLITRDARGFAQTGGIFFELSADIDPTKLPSLEDSVTPGSRVFLISVDPSAPDYLKRYPITVRYESAATVYGSARLLTLIPLQGIPLRPSTRYAAVVLQSLTDSSGHTLGRSANMATLANGKAPPGLSGDALSHYLGALSALGAAHISADQIAGFTVFTTDNSTTVLDTVVADMLARPQPQFAPFTLGDTYPGYCVYNSTIAFPDYQSGTSPYSTTGGDWLFDANGKPILQGMEQSRVVVTIPRTTIPAAGVPVVEFIRTGAGGDNPLVDRGVQQMTGGDAVPGTGPAQEYAQVGFAGIQVDGPLGGLRNPTGGNEDFLIFNVFNPACLRDTIRESAAELVLLEHELPQVSIDISGCSGASTADGSGKAHFDLSHVAFFGHSMGASILPLAAEAEPNFRAIILSGAGSSYIENVMDKQKPLVVKPVAEALLQVPAGSLKEDDPGLTLFQWAAEPSDSQIYARTIIQEPKAGTSPRQVLMLQGIVDNYIRPRIANGISLALGLDLAGAELDMNNPAYTAEDTPLGTVLWASRHHAIELPTSGNINASTTAVVVQHPGDALEDGHEVVFQTEPPKNQYRCFLKAFAAGTTPAIPAKDASGCE